MDKQTLLALLEKAKSGNRKDLERLLIFAYTPVSFQCRRLLKDPQMAEKMTEQVLKSLSSQVDKIENADHFHKWLGNVTAARCMRLQEKTASLEYIPESQDLSFPSNELSKAETARVVRILADSLPENLRICLLLSACCQVRVKAIAQMTGFTEETATKYIADAELAIQEQMQIYQSRGVVFSGSLSIAALLRAAMYENRNSTAAAAMAKKLLPPIAPSPAPVQPPKRPRNTVKILLCIATALALLLVILICGVCMGKKNSDTEETTMPSTIATTAVTETAEATTEATTEETTQPTTAPTTEATTIPETTEATMETTAETEPARSSSVPTGNGTGQGTGQSTTGTGSVQGGLSADGTHKHNLIYMSPYPNNDFAPTCESPGHSLFFCTICREVISQADPVNRPSRGGHNYVPTEVFPPSEYHEGFTTYTCTKCNDAYRADYVPALTPAPETKPPVIETQPKVVESQAPVVESPASDTDTQ